MEASLMFGTGLRRYYPAIGDDREMEFLYLSWSALTVVLSLEAGADISETKAFDARIVATLTPEELALYRQRLLEYTPLLVENFRSIAPVGELADAIDRRVAGAAVGDRQHRFAVATYALVAADLV